MELGKQIRKHRARIRLSQEELAERVFVSRQTISNWENDRSYPDIASLIRMSEVFQVSLDDLVRGDLEAIQVEIDSQEFAKFQKNNSLFAVFFLVLLITPIPLMKWLHWFGAALYAGLWAIAMFFAIRLEKFKKKHDIQTYREIAAFMDGKPLGEIEKAREEGKRPYQKWLAAVVSGTLAVIFALLIAAIIH